MLSEIIMDSSQAERIIVTALRSKSTNPTVYREALEQLLDLARDTNESAWELETIRKENSAKAQAARDRWNGASVEEE